MKMIGGPLDGGEYSGYIDVMKSFIVLELEANGEKSELLACYKFVNNQLYFISTKTRKAIVEEYE